VFVACSTLCFGRESLDEALTKIAELGFNKFDAAICERGPHVRPSEVAGDVNAAAQRLRIGPGLTPSAFSVELDATNEEEADRQFKAICRLARLSSVPVLTLKAAPADSSMEAEVARLTRLTAFAESEGVQLSMATETGTLTEDPDRAVSLCEKVPGLGLTLDPSHYTVGPNQGKNYDQVFPYVRHVHLRDTGKGKNQFQVRVGQGQIEYGRIIAQLARHRYDRTLSVDIRDTTESPMPTTPEVRKLKFLLESLV
jgi:sugar phosphate isomerase/epimerase